VVVVGYTKAAEGEYVDPSTSAALFELFPPMDDPRLGRDVPMPALPAAPPAAPLDRDEAVMATGGDRRSLRLHPDDEALIRAVVAVNPRTVVAVVAGSAVVMPWVDGPAATVMLWYSGMEGGHALADVLFGAAAPSGRLPFAIPVREEDLVSFDPDAVTETYDLFHGQWHLHRTATPAAFPFGFGLGTTQFSLSEDTMTVDDDHRVGRVEVHNLGPRAGATVVQVYAGYDGSAYERPASRLVGFARVEIPAGARAKVSVPIDLRMLDVRVDGEMRREPGAVRVRAAFHADDPGVTTVIER
jgi:beta-glucosidase